MIDVFPKANFSGGYEHFAAVVGGFNPHSGFLAESIPLDDLTLTSVIDALSARGILSTGTGFA